MKALKIVLIVLGSIILTCAIAFGIFWLCIKDSFLDGPGMEYDFRTYNLVGEWTEIGLGENKTSNPSKIIFTEDKIRYNAYGESHLSEYFIKETNPEDNVKIIVNDNLGCEYLIFHKEEINGQTIGIVSTVITEYDGRGPIIISEFAKDNLNSIPDDYVSSLYEEMNGKDSTPTYVEVPD